MTVHATPPNVVRETPDLDCLDFSGATAYNDFRDDLVRDGYAVVKGVMSPERAQHYVGEFHQWLEDFKLGYKRDDPSTIREDCLPIIHQKGLIQAYGAPHESFTWGVRSEPGVIDAFAKLFGTDDLICSFDAVNVSFPNRRDLPELKPWAHQDQDPERPGFRCVQGLVNLNPCGDNDGGLVVLKGGHNISKEYHETFYDEEREFRWTNEMYLFKETGLEWLKDRGYEWVKVNAGPGDLILWDSRVPHYNAAPKGDTVRFVVYTCMAPVSTATQEELAQKKFLFENTKGHSHWPQGFQPFVEAFVAPRRNGELDPLNTWTPRQKPVLSERAYKLTGIPYLNSAAA
ncbi:hypothetical protein JCM9279_005107 [Rhodotorula babjevae]